MPNHLVKWREQLIEQPEFAAQWKLAQAKCPLVALVWQLERLIREEMLVEAALTVQPGVLSAEAVDRLGVEFRERKRQRDRCFARARTAEDVGACLSAYPFP